MIFFANSAVMVFTGFSSMSLMSIKIKKIFEVASMEIKWISTPKSCKECEHYDKTKKQCTLKRCKYPARG